MTVALLFLASSSDVASTARGEPESNINLLSELVVRKSVFIYEGIKELDVYRLQENKSLAASTCRINSKILSIFIL